MGEHKCIDCGFLSARNIYTCNLDEVEVEFRRSGNSPNTIIGGKEIGYPRHRGYPICFVQKYDLLDLFEKTSGEKSTRFLTIINEKRECEKFIDWKQGFTPKEHKEMLDRQEMLKWQADREEADRKWREKQDRNLVMIAGGFTILGALIGALIAIFR